ncbi:hypothetical protein Pse7367_1593 [Thalassoporum mexicanum PCC 7367]|nr:hypothetical protein [Pseudanabaena sp. PCC 7367]AFY69882.1 hypothetical protein Pse7367_1593 [Pseudanabaena sp. PCC 7367]
MQNYPASISLTDIAPTQLTESIFEPMVGGDVEIDPTATIAAGVIIQAAVGSRIKIGAGVCIGMGCVIKAYGGNLKIEDGVTLGAGVLIIGRGAIGASACIGAATTIFNCSVNSGEMVATGSLLGDRGRAIEVASKAASKLVESPAQQNLSTQALPIGSSIPQSAIDRNVQPDTKLDPKLDSKPDLGSLLPELATTKTTFNEAKISISPLAINPPTYAPSLPNSSLNPDNSFNSDHSSAKDQTSQSIAPNQFTPATVEPVDPIANPGTASTFVDPTLKPLIPPIEPVQPIAPEPVINNNGSPNGKVYGKAYVEQILGVMLPHRQISQQLPQPNLEQDAGDSGDRL